MSFNNIWLLVNWGFLLLLAELLDEGHGLTLQSSGELPEGPLLLQLSSIISHGDFRVLSLVEVNQ